MPEPAIDPENFKSLADLTDLLPQVLSGPKDVGTLDMIVMRPEHNERTVPETYQVSAEEGVPGDHWKSGSGYALDDGSGDPDA